MVTSIGRVGLWSLYFDFDEIVPLSKKDRNHEGNEAGCVDINQPSSLKKFHLEKKPLSPIFLSKF